jgi:hypothetical protein
VISFVDQGVIEINETPSQRQLPSLFAFCMVPAIFVDAIYSVVLFAAPVR